MLTANKRIAKNTLLLYIRMFIMMGVSLYTSRVVLQKLGVDDFGLYNIVGGVVVLFSVFNSSLAGSTQRFLNYEMGREDVSSVNKVFQCSIMLHVILCVILIILAETIGWWYINAYLNVPLGRYDAASIVYQLSVLTFCINVLRVPFNACIIAHEKMDFYAYVSVAEAGLKLIVAFMLTMCDLLFKKLSRYQNQNIVGQKKDKRNVVIFWLESFWKCCGHISPAWYKFGFELFLWCGTECSCRNCPSSDISYVWIHLEFPNCFQSANIKIICSEAVK